MTDGRPRGSCRRQSPGGDWLRAGSRPCGLTEDLSRGVVLVEPGLEAGLAPDVYSYLRDSATGAFRLLGPGVATFADAAADDSRIVFESREQLLPDAAPDVVNLYEWDGASRPVRS